MSALILLTIRLPLYGYAFYKFYQYRKNYVAVSGNLILAIIFGAMAIAITTFLRLRDVSTIFATFTAVSAFTLARTARPANEYKEENL